MYFAPHQLDAADRTRPMQSVVYMMSSRCRAATKAWNDKKIMSDDEKEIWLTLFRQELVRDRRLTTGNHLTMIGIY